MDFAYLGCPLSLKAGMERAREIKTGLSMHRGKLFKGIWDYTLATMNGLLCRASGSFVERVWMEDLGNTVSWAIRGLVSGRYHMWEPIWCFLGRQGMVVKGPQWGTGLVAGPGTSLSTLASHDDHMEDHSASGHENLHWKKKIRWSWTDVSGHHLSGS